MGGSHQHSHGAAGKLRSAFLLVVVVLIVEITVGILAHSLALVADAGHVVTDLVALALSWFAVRQAERPPDAARTYGYHRTGIIVAFVNAATLLVIAGWISFEAYHRLFVSYVIEGPMMMAAAAVGLLVNLYIGWDLSREHRGNLNIKSVLIHVMGDALASLGVMVAAAIIWVRPDLSIVDPLVAVFIALLIAFGSWQIVHDAASVLMEGTPKHIDIDELVRHIKDVPGVEGLHDLHVWSIADGMPLLTCHVLLRECDVVTSAAIMNSVRDCMRSHFGIEHCTLQPEWELCGPDNLYCSYDLIKETAHAPHRHDHTHRHDHEHEHEHEHEADATHSHSHE